MVILAVVIAYWARLGPGPQLYDLYLEDMAITAAVALMAAVPAFFGSGLYRSIWRYTSFSEVYKIFVVDIAVLCALVGLYFLAGNTMELPRMVPVFVFAVLPVLLGGPRIVARMVAERVALWSGRRRGSSRKTAVLVVGDGPDAQLFIRASHNNPQGNYRIAGVIPVSKASEGGSILGIPILKTVDSLSETLRGFERKGTPIGRLAITQEFLSPDLGRSNDDVVTVAQSFGVEAVRLQSAESLQVDIAAEQPAVQMEPIAIEDLLGREEHGVKKGDELTVLSAKTVLVTGGGGSIGAELCRQLAELGLARLVVVDSCEFNLYKIENDLRAAGEVEVEPVIADVRDKGRMAAVFRAQRPDYVFHAAALKHVPLVEHNPGEAVLTNVLGSRNIIDLAVEHGCKAAVLVSTDKAVNPTSFMGATKRAAEIYMQAKSDALSAQRSNIAIVDGKVVGTKQTDTRLMAVRFGNVLGSSGSVVPLFEQQLQAGGPLTVTHPMVERFFMTVPEAVSLILNGFTTLIWRRNLRYTTFFLDMGEPIKIIDLASQMIRLAGFRPDKDIKIVYSGLRPGEKLYEELSYKDEEIIDVDVEGLYALSPTRDRPAETGPAETSPTETTSTVEALIDAAQRSDNAGVFQAMRRLVPQYQRQDHESPQKQHPQTQHPITQNPKQDTGISQANI